MKPILTLFVAAAVFSSQLDLNMGTTCVKTNLENHPVVKTIRLNTGLKLEYVEQGDRSGTPVIFLHGYTDSWHSFEEIMKHLPASLHALAISQRGHGNSQRPANGYDMEDFSDDLADFIRQKKLGPVVLVGHSMGGIITQQFAIDYPELVKSLVIVSSDACFANNQGLPEFEQQINELKDPISYDFANGFQLSTCAVPIDSIYFQTLVKESLKLPAGVWKKVMYGIMKADLTQAIKSISKPTLVIWGAKDMVCSKADQQVMLAGIRGSGFLEYQDAGHALHWEQPERFSKDLVAFLSR